MAQTPATDTGPGQAPRVLIVDDHRLFRTGLRELLEEHGSAVAGGAGSGEEALEVVAAVSPDVVIMDLRLPGISGVEATRRLVEAKHDVAILVLTVSAEGDDIDGALAAGAAGYLLKDASAGELVAGGRRAPGGGGAPPPPPARPRRASGPPARRAPAAR